MIKGMVDTKAARAAAEVAKLHSGNHARLLIVDLALEIKALADEVDELRRKMLILDDQCCGYEAKEEGIWKRLLVAMETSEEDFHARVGGIEDCETCALIAAAEKALGEKPE